MQHHLEAMENVFHEVRSGPAGLSAQEAAARLERDGNNKLREGKKDSLFKRFFQQMTDPMIIILLAAAAVSAVLSVAHKEPPYDMIIILSVVIINAVLGVYQESKAEAAIAALQAMSAATSKVLRDGEIATVKSEDLAVGDVILLEAGDAVPADARIFECASLQIEEAALTGESVPVTKMTDKLAAQEVTLGDRKNMVYMGSTVAYGRGRAVVTATGMETEMGRIAEALEKAEEGLTPLQIKLKQLSKALTWIVLGVCLFIFGFSAIREFLQSGGVEFSDLLDFFMVAVSLAVAAIPEGLVAVVTIVLSIGVTNLSKKNAIIRKLTAVETLGCAQIICSDKTGTLTQNKMTVVESFSTDEALLARAMALCTDASFLPNGDAVGEPTEVALINYAKSLALLKGDMEAESPRAGEAPFDSMRKMMSTVHNAGASKYIQYTKGAPDEVLGRCTHMLAAEGIVPLTGERLEAILAENARMAGQALRVLAAATREYAAMPESCEPAALEQGLCFVGLCGMIDPVRPEVKAAIEQCNSAGVTAVMITGDHRDTAVAIANELGLLADGRKAITGMELSKISDEEFERTVHEYGVYARVQPEHKVRIVNAWKARGCVTAMTGDGVNDAPSIKSADIGVGMGVTSTDVTKNVADMVLADDNFATIVSAVGEGRRIYDNIRRTLQFLLSTNISEVFSVFIATVMGFSLFRPVHLLFINLITDSLPAVALGLEHAHDDIMERPPRGKNEGIFAGGLGVGVLWQGLLISVLTLSSYFIVDTWHDHEFAMTSAFFTLSMCEIFRAFNARSLTQSIFRLKRQNKVLWGALALSLVLTLTVIYVPALATAFSMQPLTLRELAVSLALAFAIIPIIETVKFFQRLAAKHKKTR